MRNKLVYSFLSLLSLMSLLYACSPITQKGETLLPSRTPSITKSTKQPTPADILHTVMPTFTRLTPNLTPLPSNVPGDEATPNPERARRVILDMLTDNGGCSLPCLLDFTPGQSDLINFWETWDQLINITSEKLVTNKFVSEDGGIFSFVFNEYELSIISDLTYSIKDGKIELMGLSTFPIDNDYQATFGNIIHTEVTQYYQLSQILTNYGRPSRVIIAAWKHDLFMKGDYEPFSTVVIYEDQGFLIEYIAPVEQLESDFQGCPQAGYIKVRVWDPKSDLTLGEIAEINAGRGLSEASLGYFQSIEEATSMSVNEFYEAFRDPENTSCLYTPVENWP